MEKILTDPPDQLEALSNQSQAIPTLKLARISNPGVFFLFFFLTINARPLLVQYFSLNQHLRPAKLPRSALQPENRRDDVTASDHVISVEILTLLN